MIIIANTLHSLTASVFITLGFYIISWSGLFTGFSLSHGLFSTFFGVFGIMLVLITFLQTMTWALNLND